MSGTVLLPAVRPNMGWSGRWAVDTVTDVEAEEEARRAYRRRLGGNLERVRKQLTDYTQESLADALGVDIETYARWERGSREPRAYDLAQLAEKLGVPAEWLLDPTDSFTELDQRIAQLRRAAAEAARADEEEGQGPTAGDGKGAPRGKR